jgi:IS5 family transposase
MRRPKRRSPDKPIARSAAVTVRGPCASSVSMTNTCACAQLGRVNQDGKRF